jgi:hypothetical protein
MSDNKPQIDEQTNALLKEISDWDGEEFKGAYNIRVNCSSAARKSTENIKIESKTDNPGLEVHIKPGTKGEQVFIPACVTHAKVDDLVYSIKRAIKDFYDKDSWKEKIKTVMQVDFSWNKTAKEYIEIYNNL